jgi:CheY-like chemotaxis protein
MSQSTNEPQVTAEVPTGQSLSRAPSVLVVDDDEDSREALRCLLELDGYDVRSAANGIAALKIAHSTTPDIVILDINMPDLDGYAVCRLMRRIKKLSGTRIFALTASSGERHDKECSEAGFDRQLTKPLQPDALNQLLRRSSH